MTLLVRLTHMQFSGSKKWGPRSKEAEIMRRKLFPLLFISLGAGLLSHSHVVAQDNPDFHVTVNMVQLNVAVTDKNGNYITGLRPKDFAIVEDGISEKTATFAEGNEPARSLRDLAEDSSATPNLAKRSSDGAPDSSFESQIRGANVFVLFDTSNYMY